MKKILVPTDFSECADRALEFAASLAKKVSGEIFLIHIIDDQDQDTISTSGEIHSVVSGYTAEIPHMIGLLKETKVIIEEIKKREYLNGIPVQDNIELGVPGIMINKAAEKYEADIIIMGTHGAKGLKEFFIGSNAEKVIQHADRPVLAIKEKFTEPKQIIFASDFTQEAENVFGFVKKFAAIYNANLQLVEVTTEDKEENAEDFKKYNLSMRFEGADYPVKVYKDKSSEAGILHYAREINADLIAIGTHGRHGISRLFNPSVSEDLVNHSFCPVLAVNFRK
jgi:nucleotide-binding universal stress UspA family protein